MDLYSEPGNSLNGEEYVALRILRSLAPIGRGRKRNTAVSLLKTPKLGRSILVSRQRAGAVESLTSICSSLCTVAMQLKVSLKVFRRREG